MGSRGGLTGWFRKRYDRAADNVATAPIVARVLGAIGVLAILVAAAFAFVLVALSNLRGSTNEQVTANRVTTAALRLERVVDELDQSLRGFVLTRNRTIRANWERARRDRCRPRSPRWRSRSRRPAARGAARAERRGPGAGLRLPTTAA